MSITEWRWAIRDSDLPSHARLVAWALATRMDSNGNGARPSGQTLARDCAVSRATVTRALARLRADGWIEVITRPGIGNEYRPRVPQSEPGSQGARLRVSQEVAQSEPGGGSQGATKNNKKINKKINTLSLGEFDQFWGVYPKRMAKGAARKAFASARKKVSLEVILAGAQRLRDDPNREQQFTPYPATWLNGEQWGDEPLSPRLRRPPSPITAADRAAYWVLEQEAQDGQDRSDQAGGQARRELPRISDR